MLPRCFIHRKCLIWAVVEFMNEAVRRWKETARIEVKGNPGLGVLSLLISKVLELDKQPFRPRGT